jgi:signal transduction histidine kinase/HAMP domain-containing protein
LFWLWHALKREFGSKILYKIILPFLILTLLVGVAGSAVALVLAGGTEEERFNNRVAEVLRRLNDTLVDQEIANLDFLNQIVFAPANPNSGAPAVSEAIADRNASELERALDPYFTSGMRSTRVQLDRLIAFDRSGRILVDMERNPSDAPSPYDVTLNQGVLPSDSGSFVGMVLAAQQDGIGDKFAGLMRFRADESLYFATITPVYENDQVVGGMILAMRVEQLLQTLADRSQAEIVVLYNTDGDALLSTRVSDREQGAEVAQVDNPAAAPVEESQLEVENLASLDLAPDVVEQLEGARNEVDRSRIHTLEVNQREYRVAITPLKIRRVFSGYIAAGLPRDYLTETFNDLQFPIMLVTGFFVLGIIGVGLFVTRQITDPLDELLSTAKDVTAGNLRRRSNVRTQDEIGALSKSFNTMTGYLLRLYSRVLAESSQRAAIVESITDGIVVCDPEGNVQVMNRAIRKFLNLHPDAPPPARFSDVPLVPLPREQAAFSPEYATSLYKLGERFVRVSDARVTSSDGKYLGIVYMLQDLTAEVQIDQAKTQFIGTISHELRTPITTLRGTNEMLLRGMFGSLDPQQRTEIERMQHKLISMTGLINNVIVIAQIDAGSLPLELEPLNLHEVIEEAIWKLRKPIKEKGLSLAFDIPEDIPPVLADYDHFHTIVHQLVDNAHLYTQEGGITIRAKQHGEYVQIDVSDTGCGIDPSMHEQVFERFVRGSGEGEGIDSQDRGIGLGLAIVKQLVEQHGGRVWLTSAAGQGSVFSFTLRHGNDLGTSEKQDTAFGTAA